MVAEVKQADFVEYGSNLFRSVSGGQNIELKLCNKENREVEDENLERWIVVQLSYTYCK
jgi:hypothetical protein